MWTRRGSAYFVVWAAGLLLASCSSTIDTSSVEDYIGPAQRAAKARAAESQPALETATQPGTEPATQTASAAASPASQPAGALRLTVYGAILSALENNQSLAVDKVNPEIKRTFEAQQRAVFDPDITGQVSGQRTRSDQISPAGRTTSVSESSRAQVGVSDFLPTGTTVQLAGSTNINQDVFGNTDIYATRIGLTVTQALLRGAGLDVNLASLRQVRIDVLSSQYELRGFAESLVAQTEETYWDYVLAQRQIEIFESSLAIAQRQLEEIQERIRVGKLAETELAAAEAQVALRNEDLINARSTLETTRIKLLQLVNPPGANNLELPVIAQSLPTIADRPLDDVELHVQLAMKLRPDLNQARLQVKRDDLEVVKTRNGLLPKLDLFITLGKTGFAESFADSVRRIGGRDYDVLVGANFEVAPINRDARAVNTRALLSRRQALEAVANMAQTVEVDVRGAYIEVKRAAEQIRATAVTRKAQEQVLQTEVEKFRVGKSTALLVGQAERDLLSARINEVQAAVSYLKGFVELYRLEGSLLHYRGIAAPGDKPVDLNDRSDRLQAGRS